LAGPIVPRGPHEITIGKLVGLGVQDLAAAEVALELLAAAVLPKTRPAGVADLLQRAVG
jgi:ornithine cyclodeaminase/alanine dehydrogenase-like protein (mu-crystallin family)